jgi:hypothetical protein
MPVKDSLIAATALAHGLVVATRNRADFEKAGSDSTTSGGGGPFSDGGAPPRWARPAGTLRTPP